MALTFPYEFEFFGNCLNGYSIPLAPRIRSTSYEDGAGRAFASRRGRPLWTCEIALLNKDIEQARRINARAWSLENTRTFKFKDIHYYGPQDSAGRSDVGVTVSGISSTDRSIISLAGAGNARRAYAGEYLSFTYGAQNKQYFGVWGSDWQAGTTGAAGSLSIYPPVPDGATVANITAVQLLDPWMFAFIPPDGYTPFSNFRGVWGENASIAIQQKV